MGVFDNSSTSGKFKFAPAQVGGDKGDSTPITVMVTGALKRDKNNDLNNKLNYKKLVNGNSVNFGYYDTLEVDGESELLINVWALYFALQKANPDIGDEITIAHPSKSMYHVIKDGVVYTSEREK